MKAIIKEEQGIFLRDIPIPEIDDGEVLIRVAVIAYCRTDGYVAHNRIKTKVPLILGHEFSGVIESVGKNITKFKKEDRVAIMPILPDAQGRYLGPMLGVDLDGAFTEYVSVPEVAVYKIPDSMSFVDAAYLEPIAASLAVLKTPITKEQRGLILGENRIASLTKKILDLYEFSSVDVASLEAIKNMPDDSYDFAIETIATTEALSELTRVVKPEGIIILKSRQNIPVEINVKDIVRKDLRLLGAYYINFHEALDFVISGRLKIHDISEMLELEDALGVLKREPEEFENKKLFFSTHLCAE